MSLQHDESSVSGTQNMELFICAFFMYFLIECGKQMKKLKKKQIKACHKATKGRMSRGIENLH